MILKYSVSKKLFYCECSFDEKDIPKEAKFRWDPTNKIWWTTDLEKAKRLSQYGDDNTLDVIISFTKEKEQAIKESLATSSNIVIPSPEGLSYLPFQKAGVSFILNRDDALLADEMGCISGDAKISINRGGIPKEVTLKHLYEIFNGLIKEKNYKWDLTTEIYTESLSIDKKEFRLNKIIKVLNKGNKDVWELRTEKHELKCTSDHVFFTKDKELELKELIIGDKIYVKIDNWLPKFEKIISIRYVGKETVYDIKMQAPNHNFIVNGIVAHNCGKTIQTLGVINSLPLNMILIVCPATLKLNWKSELEKWLLNKKLTIAVWSTKKQENANIIIINYDIIKRYPVLQKISWDLIIGDEIHYCKNKKTLRSSAFYAIALKAKKRIYLTGTPILNRPAELFNIIQSLNVDINWFNFMTKYAGAKKTDFGWDTSGATNLIELQEMLRSTVMIRRLKKDVLTELPDKLRQVIELPSNKMTKEIKQEQRLLKEFKRSVKKSRKLKSTDDFNDAVCKLETPITAFTELSEARHRTALAKVPYAVDHIKELLLSTNKVVIFAHHKDVLERMYREFKYISVKFTGDTNVEDRDNIIKQFQTNDDIKLFFGSIKASGLGITLTASSTVVFVELDWTPSTIAQAEDRCLFKGQNVLTIKGYEKIENIKLGDLVLTHKGNWKPVIDKTTKLERQKLCVEVSYFGTNEKLKVTEDHKVYIYNKKINKFEWVEAFNLHPKKHHMVVNGDDSIKYYVNKTLINNFEYTSKKAVCRIINKNNCILSPIKKIETYRPIRGEDRVYDITVKDDHSFVTGLSTIKNCHRIGQKDSVLIQHLVVDGSIDSLLAKTIVYKQGNITDSLDSPIKLKELKFDDNWNVIEV